MQGSLLLLQEKLKTCVGKGSPNVILNFGKDNNQNI